MNQQFQEVIFWRKMTKSSHPQISFNNVLFLDEKLNFINFIILRKNGQSNEKNMFLKGYAESFPSIFFSQYINNLCNPTQSWLWLMFFYYFIINQTKVCVKKKWDYSIQCCSGHYRCNQRYISNETFKWIRLRISWV